MWEPGRVFLATERLVLRRFTSSTSDVDRLVELDGDPLVMRYLTGGVPTPRAEVEGRILPGFLRDYETFGGLGRWAADERSGGTFIGWFQLSPRSEGEYELGYRLRAAAWGKGYATEGARALVDKAFADLGAERVVAETMAVNAPSRRVMERVGLRYVRTFHVEWADPIPGAAEGEVEYEMLRRDWLAG
jgi:RimJ/RimL family protein N-acetyltransferase